MNLISLVEDGGRTRGSLGRRSDDDFTRLILRLTVAVYRGVNFGKLSNGDGPLVPCSRKSYLVVRETLDQGRKEGSEQTVVKDGT